jgi:hypothetical protein
MAAFFVDLGTLLESHDACKNGRGDVIESVNVCVELVTAACCARQRPHGDILLCAELEAVEEFRERADGRFHVGRHGRNVHVANCAQRFPPFGWVASCNAMRVAGSLDGSQCLISHVQ